MLHNELLQQAQAKLEEGVADRERYDKLVKAGTRVIYDQGTFAQLSKGIAESEDPVGDVTKGLSALLNILAHKARGTIPHDVFLQAGFALLLDALDFMEQAGLVKVDKSVLAQATKEFIDALMPTVGLTPEKLSAALQSVKGTLSNPQQMAAYQQSKGAMQ
jgi:hypothetical protein